MPLVAAIDAAAAEQGASRSRVVADILRAHFGLTTEPAAEAIAAALGVEVAELLSQVGTQPLLKA